MPENMSTEYTYHSRIDGLFAERVSSQEFLKLANEKPSVIVNEFSDAKLLQRGATLMRRQRGMCVCSI